MFNRIIDSFSLHDVVLDTFAALKRGPQVCFCNFARPCILLQLYCRDTSTLARSFYSQEKIKPSTVRTVGVFFSNALTRVCNKTNTCSCQGWLAKEAWRRLDQTGMSTVSCYCLCFPRTCHLSIAIPFSSGRRDTSVWSMNLKVWCTLNTTLWTSKRLVGWATTKSQPTNASDTMLCL